MLQRIHERLGTAGFVISIVALVAALGGGAYAASGGLTGKQKKEVEKIAKKYAGKPGPTGATGATGAAGAKGDVGAAGTAGVAGKEGAQGKQGLQGVPGQTGFTETLPAGKTETGTWSALIPATATAVEFDLAVSFPIPLPKSGKAVSFTAPQVEGEEFGEKAGAKCKVEPGEPNCVDTGCRWKFEEKDVAPVSKTPGTLCVFAQEEQPSTHLENIRAPGDVFAGKSYGPTGGLLLFRTTSSTQPADTYGVWAVTSPTS